IYANSITLTPGTLSLTVDDNGVEVHSLKASDIGELQAGEMHGRVRRLEVR
ncbi:MAG: cation transporter, partial [Actinophytocola sp.]|nr:cation transporter [Actinophytocola sp.]